MDAMMQSLPDQLGQYHILALLRQGGMGAVYKARHVSLKRTVALKVLPQNRSLDPVNIDRFRREMEAIGQLDHAHVVRAFDAGQAEGTHYLAMELLEGADLHQICQAHVLSVCDACEIVRQAALGLQYIDDNRLVHRDLKPSNLFLTTDGQVKILDLGLAKVWNDLSLEQQLTATHHFIGTYDYVAPEQVLNSRTVDIRADIYSLGCTFYRLLSGQQVFSNQKYDTPVRKLHAHTNDPIPPIHELVPDLPDELVQLLDRMLSKTPSQRPQRPAEVAAVLAPFCRGSNLRAIVGGRPPDERLEPSEISSSRLASVETATYVASRLQPSKFPWPISAARLIAALLICVTATWWGVQTLRGRSTEQLPNTPTALLTDPDEISSDPETNGDASGSGEVAPSQAEAGAGQLPSTEPPAVPVPPVLPAVANDWISRLGAAPTEIIWPGHSYKQTFRFEEGLNALEVPRWGPSLIQLGQLPNKPVRIRLEIEQADWRGRTGVFFGYREVVERGRRQGEFQLIQLWYRLPGNRPTLDLLRSKSRLGAGGGVWSYGETQSAQHPIWDSRRTLSIDFDGQRLTRIAIDGQDFPDLVVDGVSNSFTREFYQGPWGIFVDDGPAIFRNPVLE